jgi:predicted acetyltransferase
MTGIAYVGTAMSHRRRGVLTGMMNVLLEQAEERGEPLAGLWPSEAGIYGRFGFGMATQQESWRIDPHHSAFAWPVPGHGRVRFVEADEAMSLFPAVYDRLRQHRHGFTDRHSGLWRYKYFDEERVRGGWSGYFYVVYESSGKAEGYAAYRLKEREEPNDEMQDMRVAECLAVSERAYAALWRFLLDMDLVETVTAEERPPDDPLWWLLADPRRLQRTGEDGLWLRLLDPARALAERAYRGCGNLVLEVKDESWPKAQGAYRLEVSEDGAECKKSTKRPDLTLSAAELGAIYLGGVKLSDLARAGRAEEHTPGALALADAMFTTAPAPWCAHHF